jgi:IS6 family transposase
MISDGPFKCRHFEGQIILLCVRWYLRYCLSYRDLEEIMADIKLKGEWMYLYRAVDSAGNTLEFLHG